MSRRGINIFGRDPNCPYMLKMARATKRLPFQVLKVLCAKYNACNVMYLVQLQPYRQQIINASSYLFCNLVRRKEKKRKRALMKRT